MSEPKVDYIATPGASLDPGLNLDDRELKAVYFCLAYEEDPFGLTNHLLVIIIAKLWRRLEQLLALWEEYDREKPASAQPGSVGNHPEPKENSCFD